MSMMKQTSKAGYRFVLQKKRGTQDDDSPNQNQYSGVLGIWITTDFKKFVFCLEPKNIFPAKHQMAVGSERRALSIHNVHNNKQVIWKRYDTIGLQVPCVLQQGASA